MKSIIKWYLNTDDRSVGPCPLRGKGGAVGTKGDVFPSPEGRLYGFLNTKRNKNLLILIKHWNLYHLIYKNHTTSLRLREIPPSAYGISPGGGEVLWTLSLLCKTTKATDRFRENRYFTGGKFELLAVWDQTTNN